MNELPINQIIHGDSLEVLKTFPDNSVDLVVTSPPYDNLRTYNGYTFDFEGIAKQLFRVVKEGGVIVWIVGDATIDGSETGTSFRQALFFSDIGFRLHDTMIWYKDTFSFPDTKRYRSTFEYMFIFSKESPKTVNLISDRKNKWHGTDVHGTSRDKYGKTFRKSNHKKTKVNKTGVRFNVWEVPTEKKNKTSHPAPFPEKLANDHIISWSNEGDIVLDPFMGSGTTCKVALKNKRNYIGIDISNEYCAIAKERLRSVENNLF